MDLQQIEERLTSALKRAEGWLPDEQLADMLSLVSAGEPGVALENFCTQLEEYDIAIPNDVARELKEIGSAMGIRISPWVEGNGHS